MTTTNRRFFSWTWALGYDFFLSYRRSEASDYARNLAKELRAVGFEVFFDRQETPGGEALRPQVAWSLRRCRTLVVVLTPDVHLSKWVRQELSLYNRRKRRIVPISVAGYLKGSIDPGDLHPNEFASLNDLSWIDESIDNVAKGTPAAEVVNSLARGHKKLRVRSLGRLGVTIAFLLLLFASIYAGTQSVRATREARTSLSRQLSAQAQLALYLNDDVEKAGFLAAESMAISTSFEGDQVLRKVLATLPKLVYEFSKKTRVDNLVFASNSGRFLILDDEAIRQLDRNGAGSELGKCRSEASCFVTEEGMISLTEEPRENGVHLTVENLAINSKFRIPLETALEDFALSKQGNVIATIDESGNVCVFQVKTGKLRSCFKVENVKMLNLNAEGDLLELNANGRLLVLFGDGDIDSDLGIDYTTFSIWDTTSGELLTTEKGKLIALGPLGRYFAIAWGDVYRVFSVEDKKFIDRDVQHPFKVKDIIFDPSETLVVTADEVGMMRVWAVESGEQGASTSGPQGVKFVSFEGGTLITKFTDTTRMVDLLDLWWIGEDSRGNPQLRKGMRISGEGVVDTDSLAISMTTQRTAIVTTPAESAGVSVRLWDISDGNALAEQWDFRNISDSSRALHAVGGMWWSDYGTAGKVTLTRGPDFTDHRSLSLTPAESDGNRELTVNPNGNFVAVLADDSLRIVNLNDPVKPIIGFKGNKVAFGPSSLALFYGANPPEVWDLASHKKLMEIPLINTDLRASWTPDGTHLFLTDGDDDLFVVNLNSGQITRSVKVDKGRVDGPIVSGTGLAVVLYKDGRVGVWNLLSSKPPFWFNARPGRFVTLSPNGLFAALSQYRDTYISIWNTKTGSLTGEIQHESDVDDILFSEDSSQIVSYNGKTIKISGSADGRPRTQIVFDTDITDVILTQDGRYLTVSGSHDDASFGQLFSVTKTFRLEKHELIAEFCRRISTFKLNPKFLGVEEPKACPPPEKEPTR